ncbi:hypothetical protein EG240_16060 [Paenimyroides tangerinum]|uniref:Fibronectin type-III domain-containing protein n=1 Tax=Paenimyroides tangerinum TaxID=2488728 RepID=A0A3P3VY12_9FLAO|nr:AHH domain-containing protein [Paenimyroides tangerinum]RRJ86496.1 hypothetical protein EG240_16060 [Paenimyroides tangerinum]
MWQGENAHRKYHVQYRKAHVDNAEWFETYTVNTQMFLQDLEPGFTYEFRVGATCEAEQYGVTSSYIYSGIQTFSIDASENATVFNCGIVPEIEISNQQPLTNLIINETFMAGDFSVKVIEISGSNGVYSGKGFIEVPYLFFVKIGVEFTSIRINTDYKLIDGVVETTYDPDWNNVEDVTDLIEDIKAIGGDIREFYEALVNGDFDNKSDEEKEKIIKDNNDKIDQNIEQLTELVNQGIISQEEANDLKTQLENNKQCSEEAINCKPSVIEEGTSTSGPSIYFKYYDNCIDKRENCQDAANNALDKIDNYNNQLQSKKELIDYLKSEGITEFVYSTFCYGVDYSNKYVRYYGKFQGNELIVKKRDFGLITNTNGEVISNDKLLDLTGINNLDSRANFLVFKKDNKWILKNTSILTLQSNNTCTEIDTKVTGKDLEQIYDEFKTLQANELGVSSEEFNEISNNLNEISNNLRGNQSAELEKWIGNKLKIFAKENGKIVEVKKALSDNQIDNGDWTDTKIDTKIRYTFDKGVIQVKAFGIRNNIQVFENKAINQQVQQLAQHIKSQTNKFLLENNVNRYDLKGNFSSDDTFADGKKIEVKGKYVKIISEGIGLTTTLLKTGEIEEPTYSDTSTATIKAPGLVTGSFEVVAQKVTDITGLATLAYDLSTDKEVRNALGQQFSDIKTQIGNDPKEFIPILGQVVVTVLSGNTTDEWKSVLNTSDQGKRGHLVTRGTGNAIISAMSGAALVKNLPEIADKLAENIKKVKKSVTNISELVTDIVTNRNKIRNVLDTDAGKAFAKKYFDKFEKGNFEEWYENTFKKYDLGEPLNFEVHHVIPVKVLENNKELQELLLWAKKNGKDFDFNSIDNGIPLQKKSVKFEQSGHTNHPKYDNAIAEKINDILEKAPSEEKAFERIQNLISDTKGKLEADVLLGNKDVNQIVNF